MKTRVHINLEVANIEVSMAFYNKLFRTQPSKVKPDYANYRLEEPALHLALVAKPGKKTKNSSEKGEHFGIELFDDNELSCLKGHYQKQGLLPSLEEENATCCYAVADKFWMQDPDGNAWEFWVRHDDDGATLYSSNEAESCCAPTPKTEPCCG